MSSHSFENEYDLGSDFEPVVLSAILTCEGFFDKFRTVIVADAFRDKSIRSIVQFISDHVDKYRKLPDIAILIDEIRNSKYKSPGALINLVQDLPEVTDASYIGDRIINWSKWRSIDQVLSDETAKDDPREFARLIDHASRQGDSLLLEHTRLDVDKEGELASGEIIETPWEWLNMRLGGGPVRGDLAIILTVINGGKTTILTNIARHAVGMGYNVVFFTFEDGETKIKRRLLQCINGWTTEEVISDLTIARKRRDFFLSQNGGKLHIKRLRSRRDSVDDAMSFIRAVEDSEDRKVDVVITDYADRFRPQGRYNEPRHALREVYEDCKFLSSDLDVLHWTASQVAKTQSGKDVVGIEHASESTGKFESCDIGLGFGQTLEDQRLGKITMHTSKMRDAKSGETLALVADWEIQRVFQTDDETMKRVRRKGR